MINTSRGIQVDPLYQQGLRQRQLAFERARLGMPITARQRGQLAGGLGAASNLYPDLVGQKEFIDGVQINSALAELMQLRDATTAPQAPVSVVPQQGVPQEGSGMDGITAAPQGPLDTPTAPPAQVPQSQQASPSSTPTPGTSAITASPQGELDVPIAQAEAPEGGAVPSTPAPMAPSPQAYGMPISGGALWKPISESDGNLVVLFPYQAGQVVIRDAATGEVIDVGRSTGPSNGYGDTIRFSKPGAAYRNVIVEDMHGNRIAIKDGAQRIENIEVTGYGFPVAQQFVPPQLPTYDEIEAIPRERVKRGPRMRLSPSNYQAPTAPKPSEPKGGSQAKSQFMKKLKKQRGK